MFNRKFKPLSQVGRDSLTVGMIVVGVTAVAFGLYGMVNAAYESGKSRVHDAMSTYAESQGAVLGQDEPYRIDVDRPVQTSDVPMYTSSQEQAIRAAENYLDLMPFSKPRLVNQLREFEGYSLEDARYAVSEIEANWYVQAARSAQIYLDNMPMSASRMMNQLTEFDGYTRAQATYAVRVVGLD